MYFSIGILDIICEFCVCMCCKLARELSRDSRKLVPLPDIPLRTTFHPHSLFTSDLGLNFEHTYAFLFYQATLNFVHVTNDRSSYSPFTCIRIYPHRHLSYRINRTAFWRKTPLTLDSLIRDDAKITAFNGSIYACVCPVISKNKV